MAGERSERDTYAVNTIENRGCLFIYLLASERSSRDTFRGKASEISLYLLARSVASETLTGVKMKKIGDVCWRASVASETVLWVDNAKSGICYMYICMYVWIVRMPFKRASRKLFSS